MFYVLSRTNMIMLSSISVIFAALKVTTLLLPDYQYFIQFNNNITRRNKHIGNVFFINICFYIFLHTNFLITNTNICLTIIKVHYYKPFIYYSSLLNNLLVNF